MSTTSRALRTPLNHLALGLAALAVSLAAARPAYAVEHGPDPTKALLEADKGSYTVGSLKITKANAKTYGGATVYYPTNASGETFGVVGMAPGFLGPQAVYAWLAQRAASFGFVVVNIDTTTILDQPPARAKQVADAIKQVLALAQTSGSPLNGVVDADRRAVMGHSMGGGGTLLAATADPTLKAAVALTPWSLATKSFATDQVPSLIISCEKDIIAPNSGHSDRFYTSFNTALPRGQVLIAGADHMCATSLASAKYRTTLAKSAISWLKLFLDEDTRYTDLVKGGNNGADYVSYKIEGF
jgi:dienelactone hydrolase